LRSKNGLKAGLSLVERGKGLSGREKYVLVI